MGHVLSNSVWVRQRLNETACRTLFSVQNAAGGFKSILGQSMGGERACTYLTEAHLFCTKFWPLNLVQRLPVA